MMPESNEAILPTNVKPVHYQLTMTPNLEDFSFIGEEVVEIEILEPSTEISVNCIEIAIDTCQLTLPDGSRFSASDILFDESQERVRFEFDTRIPVGPARLEIRFTGELNDKLRGFYRSHYIDVEGRQRYMAATQFESTDARRAFPCWDEPSLKSTFDVILVVPSDLVAVSNMPVLVEVEVSPGVKSIRFTETPVMSTYLLAFVVGDLAAVERRAEDGTLVRVWSTRGREEQGRFALDTSVALLAYFNDYFGIPYPLTKLDHLAIPDFAAGAMENWGAITYRETALLVDPERSSAATRQRVASVVSHEMAHMWFGDLVTMAWWDDLWLNESFASWMGDKAVDQLYPEWEMWTQFVSEETNRALSLDGLRSSHPIEQEVNDPAQIGQLFDAISYSKGASILRMLENFLGDEVFQKGLRQYLDEHQYANAKTRDLWNILGQVSDQPVSIMMDTWVKQTGYPVLDIEVDRLRKSIEISCSQSRFVYEDILGRSQEDDTLWAVPISVRTASDAAPRIALIENREGSIRVEPTSHGSMDEWIKLNPLQTGYYRVNYPLEELNKLIPPVRDLVLPAADRLGIQNDTFALARAGHIPTTQFLSLAEAYSEETDASVCADLASNLNGLNSLLRNESFYSRFQAFGRRIFRPIGNRIGWDARSGEGHLDALLRAIVLSQLGEFEDREALDEATRRFSVYLEEPTKIHPDIRGTVLALAAAAGDRPNYDTMWELYRQTSLEEEKVRFLRALSRFSQPQLLTATLEKSMSNEVRVQDTITCLVSVARNRNGLELAWEFLKTNWDEFDRRYGEGGFGLMNVVSIASLFTTDENREDVERFFTDHPAPAAERTIEQSLERIRINIAWLERNRTDLESWFAS